MTNISEFFDLWYKAPQYGWDSVQWAHAAINSDGRMVVVVGQLVDGETEVMEPLILKDGVVEPEHRAN